MEAKEILYAYAMGFAGQPYLWGGDDPINGFDCSGLCIELLQAAGVFPHGRDTPAFGLDEFYRHFGVGTPDFGSLVFFGKPTISHVGFCLNGELMLEAGGGGSKTLTLADAAKQNAFVRVRPIKTRKDLVGFRHPPYAWRL